MTDLMKISGIRAKMTKHLINAGYPNVEPLKGQDPEEIYTKHCLIPKQEKTRLDIYYDNSTIDSATSGNDRSLRYVYTPAITVSFVPFVQL